MHIVHSLKHASMLKTNLVVGRHTVVALRIVVGRHIVVRCSRRGPEGKLPAVEVLHSGAPLHAHK